MPFSRSDISRRWLAGGTLADIVDIVVLVRSSPLVCINAHNKSSIDVVEILVDNPRTKHIDVIYHFTREQLILQPPTLNYVPSNKNTPNIMTKGLLPVDHYRHLNSLRLTE